jgi:hypothetical protein
LIDAALAVSLAVLAALMALLLRANQHLARRVERLEFAAQRSRALAEKATGMSEPPLASESPASAQDNDLLGESLDGQSMSVELRGTTTLLAFLSSTCTTCIGFFRAFNEHAADELVPDGQLVVVTKSGEHETRDRLRELASDRVTVLMSTESWEEFEVPLPPYFLLLSGGDVLTEGPASGWEDLSRMVNASLSRLPD